MTNRAQRAAGLLALRPNFAGDSNRVVIATKRLIVIMLPLIYNQFLEPYVYLDPKNSTLLPFTQSAVGQFSTNYQVIYSAIFASVVPIILVYLLFRRFFVEGVMAGAI
jgi:raffinose/stachyose/melibiose transport system permease protein